MKKGNKTISIKDGKLKCSICDSNNLEKIGERDGDIVYHCPDCHCLPIMTILGSGKNRLPVWTNTKDSNLYNPLSKPLTND